jgi:beta-galactosidase/beta-glucuronidase
MSQLDSQTEIARAGELIGLSSVEKSMEALKSGYPRPDFVRSQLNWDTLNGTWDFAFDDDAIGIQEQWYLRRIPLKQKITVPFAFQTSASGINNQGAHEFIWYGREIRDIRSSFEKFNGYRLVLKFGAVDYEATVWINDWQVGSHRGGHVPFELDIIDALLLAPSDEAPVTYVTVRVRDSPTDLSQPRGKQYWNLKPESIWYTPSSGIWQSVWLESLPPVRLGHSGDGTTMVFNDIENGALHATVTVIGMRPNQSLSVEIDAQLAGIRVAKSRGPVSVTGFAKIDVPLRISTIIQNIPESFLANYPLNNDRCFRDGVALWSPEYPILYNIILRLFDNTTGKVLDEVTTYTGMRSLAWDSQCLMLNGSPYFQALVLDQGYWPETGLTPPSPEALREDIVMAKIMGFNGCRKHQKVEDPRFLYWADLLGYLVWGEMANAHEFSNLYMERFNEEWVAAIKRDINHPCIVTWTPVNESWGYNNLMGSGQQRNHIRSLYFITKYVA